MPFKSLSLAAVCAVSLALPLGAHHSHGQYDTSKWTPFEGTVKEVNLINPHSWSYLEVKDDKGQPTVWALEATNPGGLVRNGIKREDVKPGDSIRCSAISSGTARTAAFWGM